VAVRRGHEARTERPSERVRVERLERVDRFAGDQWFGLARNRRLRRWPGNLGIEWLAGQRIEWFEWLAGQRLRWIEWFEWKRKWKPVDSGIRRLAGGWRNRSTPVTFRSL